MYQRTIEKEVEVVGIGLHSALPVKLKLKPANDDYGIVFFRSDKNVSIPLDAKYVVDTKLATVLGKNGVIISTVEHLLSAILAFGIDNLIIEVDNDEVPILDGSSIGYCMLLQEAGIKEQNSAKKILVIKKEVEIKDGNRYVRLKPSKENIIDFEIKFDHPMIRDQKFVFHFSKKNYLKEIAKARTFGFLKEVQYLRSIGKAKGGSLENAIVLDEKKILNSDGLRFENEFVRHKILDAIGDMALLNMSFLGRYESYAGSHHLNFMLTKKLLEQKDAYEVVENIKEAQKVMEKAFA